MKLLLTCCFALMLVACNRYPSNDFECKLDAAKAPTNVGVGLAEEACGIKFADEIRKRKPN